MTGGGIINRKSISILLLLLTIALPLNVGAISAAATNQTNTDQNLNQVSTTAVNQSTTKTLNKTVNKTVNNSKSQTSKVNTSSTQNYAAAGTAKTVSTTSNTVSLNSIISISTKLKNYILTYKKLPSYMTISGIKITMPQMLFLLSAAVIKLKSGSTTSIKFGTIKVPSVNGTETAISGNLVKTSYMSEANSIYNYISVHKAAPSTVITPLGKIRYESYVLIYSKIVSFYGTNKRLPNTVGVVPLMKKTSTSSSSSSSTYVAMVVPASLKSYLQATNNCQVDNAAIKALAASITKGINTPLARATAIYNWVRDNISYSFYYNTKYGAVGTLNAKKGNCVDTAHLLIALERAAGMPAKYEHVTAQFSSGTWYGHVIALVYVNGICYKADGTSYRNSFGVVNNWNTNTATVHGTYLTLPF